MSNTIDKCPECGQNIGIQCTENEETAGLFDYHCNNCHHDWSKTHRKQ